MKKTRFLKKALKTFQQIKKEAEKPVRIEIFSAYPELAQPLVELIGDNSPWVDLSPLEGEDLSNTHPDVAIFFLIGEPKELEKAKRIQKRLKINSYLIAFIGPQGLKLAKEKEIPLNLVYILSSSEDYEALLKALAAKIPRSKLLSAGKNFPSLRDFIAQRIIKEVAFENGWLAALGILPGADYPFLTFNQARMALELAVIYGYEIADVNRLKEILSVAAGGLLARSIARGALSFVPVAGWLAKGGIAFSGTLAMGKALQEYFRRRV